MKKQVTHRQHYIWQKYLEPWVNSRRLIPSKHTTRGIKAVPTNSILFEEDYYKIDILNDEELYVLENIFVKDKEKSINNINYNIFNGFKIINNLSKKLNDKETDNSLIQLGEDLQSSIENAGINGIDSLKNKCLSFFDYNKPDDVIDFIMFLQMQYLRTKNMRERVMDNLKKSDIKTNEQRKFFENVNWDKVYKHAIYYLINKSGPRIASQDFHILMLTNKNELFLTCDQPVINIAEDTSIEYKLYYPISPEIAIILSKTYKENSIKEISDDEVILYNKYVISNSREYIFARDEEQLREI